MRTGIAQFIFAVVVGAGAHAEPAQDQAELLFEEGRDLLDKHEPAKACARFERAIRLDPGAEGIMLNLGLCNEELGKYKSALYWFRKAEHSATESDHPMPAHERVAKEHAAAVASKVATVRITFATEPPSDVAVAIDGEPVAPDDYPRVEVDPGDHVLKAMAAGFAATQPFHAERSGSQPIVVTLAPTTRAIAPTPAEVHAADHRPVAKWIAIGGVAALVAAGGVALYGQSVYTRCTTNGVLDTGKSGCDHRTDPYAAAVEANSGRNLVSIYGTGLAVVGVAALAVGAYLYLKVPARRERAAIVPTLGRDHVGIAVAGDL